MARALVVGYDGSECARAALEEAIELAGATGDRIVIALRLRARRLRARSTPPTARRCASSASGSTAPAIERASEAGVEATLALVPERPGRGAARPLAEEHDARAIVVGTHGEHPIKGALVGSTPHKLLHLSERPVLVVPVARRLERGDARSLVWRADERRLRPARRAAAEIESYELTGHDREFGDFTRPSTVVHLRGDGQEGIGEDVVYTCSTTSPTATPARCSTSPAPTTLGEACELLGELDLFPARRRSTRRRATTAAGPTSRRRSTSPCARTGSPSGRSSSATPSRFASSARPGSAASATHAHKSSTEAIRKRLDAYPDLEFKLDPENDWDAELIDEIAGLAPVRVLDLKGMYRGTPGRRRHRPRALPRGRRDVSRRLPRGPRHQRRDRARCSSRTPTGSPGTRRCTRSPTSRRWRARRSTRSPRGSARCGSCWRSTSTASANGIAIYGGGQGELECGRGQIQYLASLFHADTPNDVAPSGYNDPAVPAGMPTSPMDPAQSETGFRWGELSAEDRRSSCL